MYIYQKVMKQCCSRGCCPWRRSQSLSGAHKTRTHTHQLMSTNTQTHTHMHTHRRAHDLSLAFSLSLFRARARVRTLSLSLFLYPLSRSISHPLVHVPTLSHTHRETLPSSKTMAQRAPPKRLNSAGYTHVHTHIYIYACIGSCMNVYI